MKQYDEIIVGSVDILGLSNILELKDGSKRDFKTFNNHTKFVDF